MEVSADGKQVTTQDEGWETFMMKPEDQDTTRGVPNPLGGHPTNLSHPGAVISTHRPGLNLRQ